jgi:hypothetical protein
LHVITVDLANIHYGILHLYLEGWKWSQWNKKACQWYVAWTQFVAEIYSFFDFNTNHLGCLNKLKKYGIVEDFITTFDHLYFIMEGTSDAFFRELFISDMKDKICAHVLFALPQTWFEATE